MCVACGALADTCVLRIVTTIFTRRKINRLRGGDVYDETALMCKWRMVSAPAEILHFQFSSTNSYPLIGPVNL